jgi:hypothetical protein
MSLLDSLIKSVNKAKAKTADLFTDTVITVSERSTYNPATGVVTKEPVNQLVSVMVDKWEYGEVNGESIRADDLKLFSFDVTTDIDESDQVLFGEAKYSVVTTTPIMAGAKMVARYIQLRK